MPLDGDTIVEPDICPGCGVLWREGAESCESCDTAGPPIRAVDQPGTGYWVGVKATFTCNACRFDSPLNHFQLGDGVRCTRCGLEQRFDGGEWHKLGALAHSVGDLGSGGPQGRFADPEVEIKNPYDDLAQYSGWSQRHHYRATPGNPLCRECRAPMTFVQREGHETTVRCSSCQAPRTYEFPEVAGRIKGLIAVVADEHEAGGAEVVLKEEAGVTLLACPGCGAPLQNVRDVDGLITCTFCSATCRISTTSHAAAGHKNTPVKTWWLYFDSPSKERNKLVNEARQRAAKARKQANKAKQRAKAKAEGKSEPTPTPKKEREKNWWVALAPAAVLLAGVPLYFVIMKPWETPEDPSANLPSDEVLKDFSFGAPTAELAKNLGVEDTKRIDAQLNPKGVFSRVSISWSQTPSRSMTLTGGEAFDVEAAEQRLEELAPASIGTGNRHEVSANLLMVRLSGASSTAARIEIMTWIKDEARANEAADAGWAVARYLAYGGDKPTPEQVRLLTGPSLAEVAELDVAVPVDKAIATVQAAMPMAVCNTVTDMMTKETELRCTVDVAHPLIDKATLAWSNEPGGTVRHAALQYEGPRVKEAPEAMKGCLDASLGTGEVEVTDHATGAGFTKYALGEAGDRVEVQPYMLNIVGPEEGAATWPAQFGKIMKAVDGCTH